MTLRSFVLSACFFFSASALVPRSGAAEATATVRSSLGERAMAALLETRPAFGAAGVGLYPFKLSVDAHALSLASHVALGGSANVLRTRTGTNLDASKVVGAVVEARLAVGATLQPARNLALTAEVGYAPWSVDLIVRPDAPSTRGSVIDLAFAVEWR